MTLFFLIFTIFFFVNLWLFFAQIFDFMIVNLTMLEKLQVRNI